MAINRQIIELAKIYNDNIACFADDITIGHLSTILPESVIE
jgi:hypothetical protein